VHRRGRARLGGAVLPLLVACSFDGTGAGSGSGGEESTGSSSGSESGDGSGSESAEGDAEESTSEGDGDSETTVGDGDGDGETSSETGTTTTTESSSDEGSQENDGPYGPCPMGNQKPCLDGEFCVWGEGWSYCTTTCNLVNDPCPEAVSLGVTCDMANPNMGVCRIGCSFVDPCPMGYACIEGGLLSDFCAWPD
jgi:hypothetical protein